MKRINLSKNSEQGRSMVEMLGTLAIMGVLSAGAIGGYSYAMNKHRTNELIYEATKRAQWVGTQLELGSDPSLNTFGADSFGFGSFSGIDNNLPNANQFGIQVSDLNKSVCDNLVNHLERTGVIRDVMNVDCNAGTATLVFNRDLSTSDSEITPDEPEVSGEASASAGAVTEPATQNPDDVHCNGNGSWNGSSCYCDPDWGGDDCSEHNDEPESSEPATPVTINNEPVITTTAQSGEDDPCSGHGDWIVSTGNANGGYCSCESGWGGDDCSGSVSGQPGEPEVSVSISTGYEPEISTTTGQSGDAECNYHGSWIASTGGEGGYCDCESGWGGTDCSKCSGHGSWNGSSCTCQSGWGGSDCSEVVCSGHGTWYQAINNGAGGCSCNSGWGGSDCSQTEEAACSGHGNWVCGARCVCDTDWGGLDCSIENACSGNGYWYNSPMLAESHCVCQSGWGGSDCSIPQ